MMTNCFYESAFGPMLLAAADGALCGAWFLGQKHFPANLEAGDDTPPDDEPPSSEPPPKRGGHLRIVK